ncbi:hypothetical protein M409DRAFT_68536 [Zasmidium cellare ATCC 36951]|uniref:Major facilitator superfamily (MFS) profile domain-containing protein n=1 Tax=Zasmidium cellare ATCC 36951 TaxID=1080233 RepID=A0A6A6C862_ZASCE|nr:uncharacterized protein M409DRAFT_68536 [Zasmidium cellare ATCC 36951]KAF2163221.1 hypothetical protein M409DRAFT_68536 [Zasmidium cellare ATCC 36951]
MPTILRWHEPETSKEEKRLILKLDLCILFYTCLSFFIKYLEQTSVTNAYVSGMQKDLHLHGKELNWITTYYNIGIIVGAPLSTPILTVISPAYWLPCCTLLSSLFVLFMYKAEQVSTLYGLRFATGLFSSTIMAGSYYLIGSWYRRSEIHRRSAIFTASSFAGSMFSGYIQAGLYKSMNGVDGLASWRWLFIFNAILGIPVALIGFFFCPNEPRARKPWWMTENEHNISEMRLDEEGRRSTGRFDMSVLKRIFCSWQFYCFPIAYGMKELTCGTEMPRWMTLYLRSLRSYSPSQINAIPTSVSCSEIVFTIAASIIADWSRKPGLVIIGFGILQIYGYAVFAAWPGHDRAWLMSTYIIAGSGYSTIGPIVYGWAGSSCGGDKQLRAVTTAMITTMGYVCETLAQQLFFPVNDAPAFKPTLGYAWGLSWTIASILFASLAISACTRAFGLGFAAKVYESDQESSPEARLEVPTPK